jgi:hypothetical protein
LALAASSCLVLCVADSPSCLLSHSFVLQFLPAVHHGLPALFWLIEAGKILLFDIGAGISTGSFCLQWRVDELAQGSRIMNMEEEQDGPGRNGTSPGSSGHNKHVNGQTNSSSAGQSYTMAKESSTAADACSTQSNKRARRAGRIGKGSVLLSILAATPTAMAATCIPLAGSTTCSAFSSASVSLDSTLIGFLYVFELPMFSGPLIILI